MCGGPSARHVRMELNVVPTITMLCGCIGQPATQDTKPDPDMHVEEGGSVYRSMSMKHRLKPEGRLTQGEEIIMRTFAALLVLVGHCFVSHTAAAAQSQDCKLCREDYAACAKAHTQGACKTNYDICMNHCRKK